MYGADRKMLDVVLEHFKEAEIVLYILYRTSKCIFLFPISHFNFEIKQSIYLSIYQVVIPPDRG